MSPRRAREVRIGDYRVAPGEPTFVVAEAGVNHNGSVETALCMVDVAASAGADAIKFQLFDADDLASIHAPTASYQRDSSDRTSQRDLLAHLELTADDFARIKRRCDDQSILFLATPFGVEQVAVLKRLSTPAIKIASTDLTTEPLLAAACDTGLPLIVSTGASERDEIERAVRFVSRSGAGERLILLHCVSCYPTQLESINLRGIAALHEAFCVPAGLSDHTTSTRTGALAVCAGACVLEKHFTLDPNATGPDHAMSLDPKQLSEYIARVREAEQALGSGTLGMTSIEADVRTVARKSIVSAERIRAGEVISAEKLLLKRPGTGLAPHELASLIGRRAIADIPRDTLLAWDMTSL